MKTHRNFRKKGLYSCGGWRYLGGCAIKEAERNAENARSGDEGCAQSAQLYTAPSPTGIKLDDSIGITSRPVLSAGLQSGLQSHRTVWLRLKADFFSDFLAKSPEELTQRLCHALTSLMNEPE